MFHRADILSSGKILFPYFISYNKVNHQSVDKGLKAIQMVLIKYQCIAHNSHHAWLFRPHKKC